MNAKQVSIPPNELSGILAYANAGGRVFASDFSYSWLYRNGNFSSVAQWAVGQDGSGSTETAVVDLTHNPKGMVFEQWLQLPNVNVLPPGGNSVTLRPVFLNSNGINTTTTDQWLYRSSGPPIQFTFNTPVGAMQQCGKVIYNDWHAQSGVNTIGNPTFPSACTVGPSAFSSQEKILEYSLFDLTSCVPQPFQAQCTPESCSQQGIQCGPAGDGCGNLLNCGSCSSGQTCGGGGPGVCGIGMCTPKTCAELNQQCGPAGDGCGNIIQCGTCTGQDTCGGGGTPGICGHTMVN